MSDVVASWASMTWGSCELNMARETPSHTQPHPATQVILTSAGAEDNWDSIARNAASFGR
jgi:hypothetical protein